MCIFIEKVEKEYVLMIKKFIYPINLRYKNIEKLFFFFWGIKMEYYVNAIEVNKQFIDMLFVIRKNKIRRKTKRKKMGEHGGCNQLY